MNPTKDQQQKAIVVGMALGVLAQGVDAVTSNKMALESAFNYAWRRWPAAGRFPSIKGHNPGNLFWIGSANPRGDPEYARHGTATAGVRRTSRARAGR